MAVPARVTFIPAPWANSAQTSIPVPPVKGIGYRNTALSTSVIQAGQLYGSIGDSSAWNQYLWQLSNVAQACEVYGIAPYNGSTTYKNRSLCLYTNELIYRAKMDVPTGTPCTNATYWEQYIPDGVQVAPPITTTAGLTLYVDYSKSTSGDGLTLATAFKNFTDCFTALRIKYAAANGVFASPNWIPLFTIIARGASTFTTEATDWYFQNVNLEIQFQNAVTISGSITIQGSVVKLTGPQMYMTKGFTVVSSDVTFNIGFNNSNTNTLIDGGAGLTVRNSNITVPSGKYIQAIGVGVGIRLSGAFVNNSGNIYSYGTGSQTSPFIMVSSDLYNDGTLDCDCTTSATGAGITSTLQQSIIRNNGGTLSIRYLEMIGSTITCNNGIIKTGSRYSRPDFGIVLRGSNLQMVNSSVAQYGSYAPTTKGAATVGGNVDSGGVAQASWLGANDWIIFGNGFYAT